MTDFQWSIEMLGFIHLNAGEIVFTLCYLYIENAPAGANLFRSYLKTATFLIQEK